MKLVTEVNARAADVFPQLEWWKQGIPVFVQKQFPDKGRYTLRVWNQSRMGLLFGLETGRADEATYTVWLEADPRFVEIRPRAHALAEDAHLLLTGWEVVFDGWKILQAGAHTVNYPTLDTAAAWFLSRFDELDRAGLFRLLVELRAVGSELVDEQSEEIAQ